MPKQTKKEEVNLEELSELSGEKETQSPPKYVLPIVRLNGLTGGFVKTIFNSDGNKEKIELGKSIKGVILKIRRTLNQFSKDYSLYSNEHNSWKDTVTIFERKKNAKGETTSSLVFNGTVSDARKNFPGLKMVQVIYFLLDGEIVKLLIKGKGLSNLFDYWAEFDSSQHSFQYITEINNKEEESPLGKYYSTTFFNIGEAEDMKVVSDKIREVAMNIQKSEDYYAKNKPNIQETPIDLDVDFPKEEAPEDFDEGLVDDGEF